MAPIRKGLPEMGYWDETPAVNDAGSESIVELPRSCTIYVTTSRSNHMRQEISFHMI